MANSGKEFVFPHIGGVSKQPDPTPQTNPLFFDESNEIVNCLKSMVYSMCNQEETYEKPNKRERICLYPEWKGQLSNLPKQGTLSQWPTSKPSATLDDNQRNKDELNDFIIPSLNYLTQLFNKIIAQYRSYWETEKEITTHSVRRGQGDMTSKDQDKIKLDPFKAEIMFVEDLQKNFMLLIESIQNLSMTNRFNYREIIDQLESILLNHKIRGKTLIEIYSAYNNLKNKSGSDTSYDEKETYSKFVEDFLSMGSLNNLNISTEERTPEEEDSTFSYRNTEPPDHLYIRELMSFPPRKSSGLRNDYEAQAKTMANAYHLIPSIMAICESDDEEIETNISEDSGICSNQRHQEYLSKVNRVCYKTQIRPENKPNVTRMEMTRQHFPSENITSQWSSHIQNFQMLHDSRPVLNGEITAVNRESRKSFILDMGGNFGSVEMALSGTGQALALKRIPKEYPVCNVLKNILNPLLGLRHNNVLHYYACDYEENELILATPLCEYNLGQYLMFMKMAPDIHLPPIAIIRQILIGLKFLHDRMDPIIHGNLKPSNTFIDLNGSVRIAEFGMHKALFKLIEPPNTSTIWFSPETLRAYKKSINMECTCASDIQVAGMLIHFIITAGKHPYGEKMEEILDNLEKSVTKVTPGDVDLNDLISWMLLHEPNDRPNIHQILSHITFWSVERKWRFMLTCAGVDHHGNPLNIPLQQLHDHIDFVSRRDKIRANWVSIIKKKFPKLNLISGDDDSASGLLKLIGTCMQNQNSFHFDLNQELRNFVLVTFPALPLSLYRILQASTWLECEAFRQFTTTVDSTL